MWCFSRTCRALSVVFGSSGDCTIIRQRSHGGRRRRNHRDPLGPLFCLRVTSHPLAAAPPPVPCSLLRKTPAGYRSQDHRHWARNHDRTPRQGLSDETENRSPIAVGCPPVQNTRIPRVGFTYGARDAPQSRSVCSVVPASTSTACSPKEPFRTRVEGPSLSTVSVSGRLGSSPAAST